MVTSEPLASLALHNHMKLPRPPASESEGTRGYRGTPPPAPRAARIDHTPPLPSCSKFTLIHCSSFKTDFSALLLEATSARALQAPAWI